jgi:hypothetical protein
MVGLLVILKTGRLLNIYFYIDVAIEKYTPDIHLIELDIVGTSIGVGSRWRTRGGQIVLSKT